MLFRNVSAQTGQKFMNTERHDPYRNFNFKAVFVGRRGIYGTGWTHITPAKARVDYKEYQEGGNLGTPHQIPDNIVFEPMVFTRGMSEDLSISDAFSSQWSYVHGTTNRDKYTVNISVLDRNKTFVKSIILYDAWISAWDSGELDAMGASVLIESATLNFASMEIINGRKSGGVLFDKSIKKYLGAL
jgi:phage tail-like protein